jgi:hypothetical protein
MRFEGLWGTDPNAETFDHEGAPRHLAARLVGVLHSYQAAPTRRVTTNTTGVSHEDEQQDRHHCHRRHNDERRTQELDSCNFLIVLQFTNFEASPKIWANKP